jgi:hypothetical protein
MKKAIFFLMVFFSCTRLYSQVMMVYDAKEDIHQTNTYLLGLKNFGQTVQQSAILSDTYKLFQDAQKVLSKINRAVSDYYVIRDIVKGQIETVKLYGYYYSTAQGFTHVSRSRVTSFISLLSNLNTECAELIKHADLILQPDYFTMSDADRMRFLGDTKNKLADNKTLMCINYKKLKAEEDDAELRSTLMSKNNTVQDDNLLLSDLN